MTIPVYRRDLDVGGISTADDAAPAALNSNKFVGVFQVPVASYSTTPMTMTLIDVPLPGGNAGCEFYLQNNLTPTIPAGWTLTVIPKTDIGATA